MVLTRDEHLRLESRKLMSLRAEQLRRLQAVRCARQRLLLAAVYRDGGVTPRGRALAYHAQQVLPGSAVRTRHRLRCRLSGRARQVRTATLAARMHFRSFMAEGYAPLIQAGRS